MSTEARGKAWDAYYRLPEHDGENVGHTGQAFAAAWDARGQVTPDPNLRRDLAVLLATKQYTGTPWCDEDVWQEDLSDDEREEHFVTADAILALFTEKGNE